MTIIGITCLYEQEGQALLPHHYFRAVEKAGGLPVLLPPLGSEDAVPELVGFLDGLILAGGGDIDPLYFGEEATLAIGLISPERDWFEITLARRALAAGRPILGICRGMQVLNVAAGGDIHQDIGTAGARVKHFQDAPRWYPTHAVHVYPGTRLAVILGERELRVNSFHHQAVRRLAPGLRAAALAADGIVEAVEGTGRPFVLGVQFHPESMWERYPIFLELFTALVEAARRNRSPVKLLTGDGLAGIE